MKNARNVIWALINLQGFVRDVTTGLIYNTNSPQAAMKMMTPGDIMIPIKDAEQLAEYESGTLRVPPYNRSGLR
jgi:hypothetical protein